MGDTGRIAAELAEHDGVITAKRAMECGLSRAQIHKRVTSGTWLRVGRGVLRSAAHPYTEAALVRAAAAAHKAVVDRLAAAWWHGLVDELPEPLTLAVRNADAPLLAVAGGDTESAAERKFLALVRSEDITGWVLQHRVGPWRIDVAWPAEKVAVEIDGWAFHHGVEQFDRDRRKRNALSSAHWIVLSFTWHQLTYEPEDCMRQLAEALAERRAETSRRSRE